MAIFTVKQSFSQLSAPWSGHSVAIFTLKQSFSQSSAPLRIHVVSHSSQVNDLGWERSEEDLNKVGIPCGSALPGKLT